MLRGVALWKNIISHALTKTLSFDSPLPVHPYIHLHSQTHRTYALQDDYTAEDIEAYFVGKEEECREQLVNFLKGKGLAPSTAELFSIHMRITNKNRYDIHMCARGCDCVCTCAVIYAFIHRVLTLSSPTHCDPPCAPRKKSHPLSHAIHYTSPDGLVLETKSDLLNQAKLLDKKGKCRCGCRAGRRYSLIWCSGGFLFPYLALTLPLTTLRYILHTQQTTHRRLTVPQPTDWTST